MKKLLSLLLISIIAVATLSSCNDNDYWDDPYYYSPLVGNWELYSVNGYPVSEIEVSEFQFLGDGRGTFGQYANNSLQSWSTYQITWFCDFPDAFTNILYVNTWNGGTWTYIFTVTYDTLTLRDTSNGNILVYTAY